MRRLLYSLLVLSILAGLAIGQTSRADAVDLERGFARPPESTKPWCYWYWISDNLSKEGLTRDLEGMARVGIGQAFVGNIFLDEVPAGKVKVLSEQWWGLVDHVIREGDRTGVKIGIFNCPGWSQSGGPWVKPDQAMRYLVSSETRVTGPARFEKKLPVPKEPFQDVALLALPAPPSEADTLATHAPKVTCTPAMEGTEKLFDGKLDTALTFPDGTGVLTIDIQLAEPLVARSLTMIPSDTAWAANCELQAADDAGQYQTVRTFKFDRSNMVVNVGPMPRGPVAVSLPVTTATRFRLLLTGITGKAALAEVKLSAAAVLESFVEKQLGKMLPTPLPKWDTYLWPQQPEPDSPKLAIRPEQVVNLTGKLASDGTLRWDIPPGDWVIVRTGMTTTGTKNSPASPEGQGLEIDKMNREVARSHFDAFIGQVLRRLPASDRKAFTTVVADSYEMGSQNWTDGFAKTFQKTYGYDPTPWLPVLTGRLVGSAEASDRFLWDLRRLVADHIALDYVGGLRDLCREQGLRLWLENYGHWGFPAEFLQYGGQSDGIGGEYWVTGDLGSIECRAASSCANTYGKPIVSAESFTGGPAFQNSPRNLKARGDWAFCEGINHFVLHVNIHQPSEDRKPGVNAWFGTEFNRHNTWFEASTTWIDYLRRCCFLLQQGTRGADVAYFIGEDTPKMTGIQEPELPPGRDFDYINAEIIQTKLRVKDGLLTLPHGTTYRVLVLPKLSTMRPALLRRISDLVKAGATVLGPPPSRSPSLQDYPHCDAEVRKLADELWGDPGDAKTGQRQFGKGRVIWGKGLEEVLDDTAPDFTSDTNLRYTHRVDGDTHIYFVANPRPQEIVTTAVFRVGGKAPELWWPDSGRIERPAVYDLAEGTVRMPIHLGPHGSVFVVFRKDAQPADRVLSVSHNDQLLLDTKPVTKEPNSMPRPGVRHPAGAIELTYNDNGSIEALAWQSGEYTLKTAAGKIETLNVTAVPEPLELAGPWDVQFTPGWGAPERVTFEQLKDWTQRPEEGIRHYSGKATYRKKFVLPESLQDKRLCLDLGTVRDLATVRLNGRDLGTLWLAPWRVDITNAARPGENVLEIEVINPWNNRLVGDMKLPPEKRYTFLVVNTLPANTPLLPAGLLGPVTVQAAVRVEVK